MARSPTVADEPTAASLAGNLMNPLRGWLDDDERGGAAACRAYATALRAIEHLPGEEPERTAAAYEALHHLVITLNGIEDRYHLIDTLRRDEAGEAFMALAERAGIAADAAGGWFDEWREF